MAQGSRPDRVGEEIRHELASLLAREVHDPGIGFVTLTRVKVSPDLQLARVYYTTMGDEKAQKATAQALSRATPFLRRQIGARVRLRRVPEIRFEFDKSVENQDRIEKILMDLKNERERTGTSEDERERAGTSENERERAGTSENERELAGTDGSDRGADEP
jgi:ribosome-binding factor A